MSLKVEWDPPEPDGLRRQCEVAAAGLGYRIVARDGRWSIMPILAVPASGRLAWQQFEAAGLTLEEVARWLSSPWSRPVQS